MYSYDDTFLDLASHSYAAAKEIIHIIRSIAPIESVLDVGCARGSWLRAWKETGCLDILGVDGPYIDKDALEIPEKCFIAVDLNKSIFLGRTFDLSECLEVAEHLQPDRAESLITDLVRHSPVVLFSAAAPGQGGENHVNERPCHYWQGLFERHGYLAIDCLRPLIRTRKRVPYWYRYNLILYATADAIERLPPFVRNFVVPSGQPLADNASFLYTIRKAMVRCLPRWLCDRLARLSAVMRK